MAVTNYFGEMLRSFGNTATDWRTSDGNGLFQFRALVLDTVNQGNVLLGSVAGSAIYGVLMNAPNANETAQVCVIGETKIQLQGTVAFGTLLSINANGNFVAQTGANIPVGIARNSGVSGDIITAWINGGTILQGVTVP